jgi:hypothetical protein
MRCKSDDLPDRRQNPWMIKETNGGAVQSVHERIGTCVRAPQGRSPRQRTDVFMQDADGWLDNLHAQRALADLQPIHSRRYSVC